MFKKRYNNGKPKGFTLIELLVVVALLGILSGGILIALNITGTVGKATLSKAKKFAAQLENGLAVNQVGKWSFEDGSGDAAKDTSGYANNGDLAGTGTICSAGGALCPTWRTPAECDLGFGGCLKFDQVDADYVQAPSVFGDKDFKSIPFTITAWTELFGTTNWHPIIAIKPSGTNFGIQIVERPAVGVENVAIVFHRANNDADGRIFLYSSVGSLKREVWNYIVVTYNGSGSPDTTNTKIFINGVRQTVSSALASVTWFSDNNSLRIGRIEGDNFDGLIDEVQIYNQPLTLSQIQELYAQGFVRHLLARK